MSFGLTDQALTVFPSLVGNLFGFLLVSDPLDVLFNSLL